MREYAIEEAGEPERLVELIKLRLRDGWQLQGGVSMIRYTFETPYGGQDTGWWYAQALIRDADAHQP